MVTIFRFRFVIIAEDFKAVTEKCYFYVTSRTARKGNAIST